MGRIWANHVRRLSAFTLALAFSAVSIAGLASVATAADYIVGSGDVLRISVWGVPELSVDAVVRPDGKITIPAVGDVKAAGNTTTAIADTLSVEVSKLVKQPVVTVAVLQITNNKIYLTGAGVNPSVMSFAEPTTLMRLLAAASGLERADLDEARVLRDGEVVYKGFAPLFIDGDISADFALMPSDIVFIPSGESKKVYVIGAVASPRSIIFRKGLTVLDAVYESGGFLESAEKNAVLLMDDTGNSSELDMGRVLNGEGLEANRTLKPGDYLVVRDYGDRKIYVSGAVVKATTLVFKPGMKLLDAIYSAGGFNQYANPSNVILIRGDGTRRKINLESVVEGDSIEGNIGLLPGDNVIVLESIF